MIRGEYIMHYAQKTSEMNHEKIQLLLSSDFIQLHWLFNRDPYQKNNAKVYYDPNITGQYYPLYTLNNQGPFFHCSPFTKVYGLVKWLAS